MDPGYASMWPERSSAYKSIVTKNENQTAKRRTVLSDVNEPLSGYSADAEVDGF